MFGWFTPRCPLDTQDKVWVERRMLWLAHRFGIERMRAARVILPTDEYFPDKYSADDAYARRCLDRMAGYMGVDPGAVGLEIVADELIPGAAGLYEMRAKSVICVARSQLADPKQLLATLAHELAHELLLKDGHLTPDVSDHEQVTDLLPVFLGIGVFLANATVVSTERSEGSMGYFSISKQGYLSSITLGYALALFAFVRGEDRPAWVAHLRPDAAVTLRAGVRFLHKTGDSLFHPDTIGTVHTTPTRDDVAANLADRSPTVRLAALWDIAEYMPAAVELLPAVERCLADRDPDVQSDAVRTLGGFGPAAAAAVPRLIKAAWYGTAAVRIAACYALGEIGTDSDLVVPALASVVEEGETELVCGAADALARFGRKAEVALPQLLNALESAASVTDYNRVSSLIAAIRASSPDGAAAVRRHFAGSDPQVRRIALAELRDQGV